MRLKLDENIAVSAAPRLAALGFDADTALDEGLGGRPESPAVVVDINGARVEVRAGVDRATLAAVVDVLTSRGGAS